MNLCYVCSELFSITDKQSYVLSVRDHDVKINDACVKHYRVRKMDNGGFYISPRRTFPGLLRLVQHYQGNYLPNSLKLREYLCFTTIALQCDLIYLRFNKTDKLTQEERKTKHVS